MLITVNNTMNLYCRVIQWVRVVSALCTSMGKVLNGWDTFFTSLACKRASMLHKTMRWLTEIEMVRNEVNMNNSVKWSWFKVPVKVKQVNDNLFSDNTKSKYIRGVSDMRMNDSEMTMRWSSLNCFVNNQCVCIVQFAAVTNMCMIEKVIVVFDLLWKHVQSLSQILVSIDVLSSNGKYCSMYSSVEEEMLQMWPRVKLPRSLLFAFESVETWKSLNFSWIYTCSSLHWNISPTLNVLDDDRVCKSLLAEDQWHVNIVVTVLRLDCLKVGIYKVVCKVILAVVFHKISRFNPNTCITCT
jgi:hypothetical protein